ncbi:hypothetical protein CTI14_58230, partial [Methylobacterium radiotolerans]
MEYGADVRIADSAQMRTSAPITPGRRLSQLGASIGSSSWNRMLVSVLSFIPVTSSPPFGAGGADRGRAPPGVVEYGADVRIADSAQ